MKNIDAERERLAKYKNSKSQRLKDLEEKTRREDVYDNIDTEKLVNQLTKKDAELKRMQDLERYAAMRVDKAEFKRG